MIPSVDSMTIATIQNKGIESVAEWFERNKQPFYALGWFYLRNQQQMEELFYRSIIKVHKELPRYKSGHSFQLWVTEIFIEHCRELSRTRVIAEMEPHQELFKAIDQLEDDEKEAMILTYGAGFSQEDAAQILRFPADKMKGLLFAGTHSARKQFYGATFNGCQEYQRNYLAYLEKSMDRPEKIEFEKHIYNCQECQEDLATFQEVTLLLSHAEWMNDLPVPEHFMEKIRKRLTEKEKQKQEKNKKRKRMTLVFASALLFVLGFGFFTGAFTSVYYAMTEKDEHLSAFLKQDLGERVNLEAESNGVKIKIKGVVADDFQTLVFYEIEDEDEDKQYFMGYEDGLFVENESEIMNQETYPRHYPPDLEAEMNKKEKNVFYGKVGLRPLSSDTGTMKLKIIKLQRLTNTPETNGMGFIASDHKTGEWNFEVPVTKQTSSEYELNEQAEIEGFPIRLNKLIIAPTATVLDYAIPMGVQEKRIDFVQFGDIEVNDKKLKADLYGGSFSSSQPDTEWQAFQTHYAPLYGEKPTEVAVQFQSAHLTYDDKKSIEIDVNQKYPQTFEYADSTISIEKIEVGQPTTIVMTDRETQNRNYESLQFSFVGENDQEIHSMSMESKSVLVDKNGVEYDPYSGPIDYEKIEQPRHLITEQIIKLDGDKVIPKRLELYGYNVVKYIDDIVEIAVE